LFAAAEINNIIYFLVYLVLKKYEIMFPRWPFMLRIADSYLHDQIKSVIRIKADTIQNKLLLVPVPGSLLIEKWSTCKQTMYSIMLFIHQKLVLSKSFKIVNPSLLHTGIKTGQDLFL